MAKRNKKEETLLNMTEEQLEAHENNYLGALDTDSKFSLEVDPENKYNMSDTQKEFIAFYVQYKNVPLAAKLAGIEEDAAMDYFNKYSSKMEIRRINLALYHRAFATKLLSVDEIGGYLTSLLVGENIAEAEKLGKKDKLQVVKLLLEINQMKQNMISNPKEIIDAIDVQEQLNELSVETIQKMIEVSNDKEKQKKEDLIEEVREKNSYLTPEEIAQLNSMSTKELMELLKTINSEGN